MTLTEYFIKNKKKFKKTVSAYGANLVITHPWATLSKVIATLIPPGLSLVQSKRKNLHSLFSCGWQKLKASAPLWFPFHCWLGSELLLKCNSKCSPVIPL